MIKNNWTRTEVEEIYNLPFMELVYRAATVHRQYNDPQEVQISTLLSIKTGGCPEDCSYCSQAARYHTDVKVQKLMETPCCGADTPVRQGLQKEASKRRIARQ